MLRLSAFLLGLLCLAAAAVEEEQGDVPPNGLCCNNVKFTVPAGSASCGGHCPSACPAELGAGAVASPAFCEPADGHCGHRQLMKKNVPQFVCIQIDTCLDGGLLCEWFDAGTTGQATEAHQGDCTALDTPCLR